MSATPATSTDEISEKILFKLNTIAENQNVILINTKLVDIAFTDLIIKLSKDRNVVVLIDEYDAPILNALDKDNLIEIKEILRNFYSVLKEQEDNIEYLLQGSVSLVRLVFFQH